MFSYKAVVTGSFFKGMIPERLSLWIQDWTSLSRMLTPKCCCSSAIPPEAREPYIESHYRRMGTNVKESAFSLFKFHNETVNVWTHLFAACYFLAVLYRDMSNSWNSNEAFLNLVACFVFAFCLFVCFLASASAHLFNCMSVEARKTLFVIDYAGVGMNALGGGIAYTAYMPEEWIPTGNKNTYSLIIIIMVCLATTGCSLPMVYWSDWPAGQVLKAVSFGSIAIQGNLPLISYLYHLVSTDPQSASLVTPYFWYYFLLKSLCAFFLTSAIPERCFARTFDIFGHSHQLFHVAGFFCVLFQYKLGYALSTINPVVSPSSNSWRVVATLLGGSIGLSLVVAWFILEIRRLKKLKLS